MDTIPFAIPLEVKATVTGKPGDLMNEHQIHVAIADQVRRRGAHGLVWWHTPNQGTHNVAFRSKLKKLGARAGVGDLVFLLRGRFFSLEIKTVKGRPTVDQMQFASDVNAAGGCSCVCHGLDAALRVLETWKILRGQAA